MGSVYAATIIEILTATPRRFTNHARGLTVAGDFYAFADGAYSGIEESADSTAPLRTTVKIPNAGNLATDLVTDRANMNKPITISRVLFDADWNQTSVEVLFQGRTGKPSFEGQFVAIDCKGTIGRTGLSPVTMWSSVMTSHTPPPPNTLILGRRTS